MNDSLAGLLDSFWLSLSAFAVTAAFCWILIRRRHWWLRFMDTEGHFWKRIGIPTSGSFRKFGESRFFTISIVVFAVLFLLMALTALALYFYFRQRLQS